MKFDAHGSYQLSLRNNVIVMTVSGEWNKEAAEQAFSDIRALLPKITTSTFGKIIDARQWSLGTPEFQYFTKQALQDLVEKGLRCEAYIVLWVKVCLKKNKLDQ
ncbi:hypothetical protein VT06_01765 [Arsukibacterium sp. MJ3]|uniref:hypothetical protein n=1 Tax=Arsukibacterium sp. MJ3 TaxID=1632859 RepID=UPI0006270145|nr:hypothetical protein [Arsukibacterium sp. MJ3]KKO50207.1 hypothetical protein VT06_01765 [Arsukibacterium sp. MJ3]